MNTYSNEYFIDSLLGKINVIEGVELDNVKGIILHIHGVGSHFQFVYPNLDEFTFRDNFFSKFSYRSVGFEFYGHGKSQGLSCSIGNYNNLIHDLNTVVTHIAKKYPKEKIFLCAESMGGAIVLKYIIDFNPINLINGICLLSPMCGIDDHLKPNPFMTWLLLHLSELLPNLQYGYTTKNMQSETTQNNDYIDAAKKSKYGHKGSHRLCTMRELYKLSLWIPDNVHLVDFPILIIHGLCDKVTTPKASINAYNKIKSHDKEILLLPYSDHCLLVPKSPDDLTPNFVYNKILSWLEKH